MYKKFMKIASVFIVSFIILYLGALINWIFYPIIVFLQTLFVPIILSLLLFYISKPFVKWLSTKISRTLSILVLYMGFAALIVLLFALIIPEIRDQFTSLVNSLPMLVREIETLLIQLQESELVQQFNLVDLFKFEESVENLGSTLNSVFNLVANTVSIIGVVISALITLFVVAFLLFYMLKEGDKFPKSIVRFVDNNNKAEVLSVFHDMDQTLGNYIQGLIIVCSSIGFLCYIAFSVIGLEFALILALIAMITNVIPYLGPWIGAIPAVIVALIQSPILAISVIVIIVVIQQVESLFIQPQVMGKKMKMHPVTVLFLVLVAGQFAGIVGMILAVPIYAIGKVIVIHSYRLFLLRQKES